MNLSERLEKLSDEIDVFEEQLQDFEYLKQANRELQNENEYMRDLLRQLGVDDIWGDFTARSLSVADVMALEKAIAGVKAS